MSDSGDYTAQEQSWTPTKGQTQGVFDPSQIAYSGALNYAGMPTEYYDKSGSMIGYLGKGDNIMSTSGLNFVDQLGKPTSISDKHSLYQLTDEQGNLLYNDPRDTSTSPFSTQDLGYGPASRQLSGMISMNAPSPGILQDPLFRNFLISAASMGAAAAFAPAAGAAGAGEAGALGSTGDFIAADMAASQAGQGAFNAASALGMPLDQAVTSGLIAADGSLTAEGAAALMGTTAAESGAGALTGSDLLKYGQMGLKGLGALSSLAGSVGSAFGTNPRSTGTSTGGGSGGTTNVYNSSGPWNTPLKSELATVGAASQRPITSGLENLEMLEPSADSSFSKAQEAPKQSFFTYGSPVQTTYPTIVEPPAYKNGGGVLQKFKNGGQPHVPEFITGATGHYVKGRGDGQSDDIPAMLADGEYVFDADTVAQLGNGSSDAGAKVLDRMREELRGHKRSAPVDKIPPKAKSPLEYIKQGMKRN